MGLEIPTADCFLADTFILLCMGSRVRSGMGMHYV